MFTTPYLSLFVTQRSEFLCTLILNFLPRTKRAANLLFNEYQNSGRRLLQYFASKWRLQPKVTPFYLPFTIILPDVFKEVVKNHESTHLAYIFVNTALVSAMFRAVLAGGKDSFFLKACS